jgi:hypothetical protein
VYFLDAANVTVSIAISLTPSLYFPLNYPAPSSCHLFSLFNNQTEESSITKQSEPNATSGAIGSVSISALVSAYRLVK